MKPKRTFRGAVVREKGTLPPIMTALNLQVEHYSTIGYEVAREGAKRKKNWAKRWFKTHKPGSFYP